MRCRLLRWLRTRLRTRVLVLGQVSGSGTRPQRARRWRPLVRVEGELPVHYDLVVNSDRMSSTLAAALISEAASQ
jgi:hypothetical protein